MTNFTFNVIKDDRFDFTPMKAHEFDSGYDCRAWLPDGDIVIQPVISGFEIEQASLGIYYNISQRNYNHVKIPLGFSIDINQEMTFYTKVEDSRVGSLAHPLLYKLAFSVRGRSGNAFNSGIQGHIGTIDTTYNNQIYVMLYNTSNIPFIITHGQKVCQIVPELIPQLSHNIQMFDNIEELDGKGRSGFGSTGLI